jgi:hypothetical protein
MKPVKNKLKLVVMKEMGCSAKGGKVAAGLLLSLGCFFSCAEQALADAISPNINDGGKTYSDEKPNAAFFGKGLGGRLNEASYLRFAAEQAMLENDYEEAYRKASKALQFDSADPHSHVLYAKSMTGKLRKQIDGQQDKENLDIDRALLAKCIKEWKLIQHHDADISEQFEARDNVRKLLKIVKLLKQQDEAKAVSIAGKDVKGL